MTKSTWIFVDDQKQAAQSHAAAIEKAAKDIAVTWLPSDQFRGKVLAGEEKPEGVLLDIDLSAWETGAGIAQDIRLRQKAHAISEFPVVRFAGRKPVEDNITGDPGSDDLFDFKISKESALEDPERIVTGMRGVHGIYSHLTAAKDIEGEALQKFIGLDEEKAELWSDPGFHRKLAAGLDVAIHVAAGVYLREFLQVSGLLIDETILSYRLGIDAQKSNGAWKALLEKVASVRYVGVASDHFPRWWAKGLESLWLTLCPKERSLALSTVRQRVDALTAGTGIKNLVSLSMPDGSAGDRPWSACSLSIEKSPPVMVPIDPKASVRITPRQTRPTWVDPFFASLGEANQNKRDKRLHQDDLVRLNAIFNK